MPEYKKQVGKKPFFQNVSRHRQIQERLEFIKREKARLEKIRTGGKIPYTWEWLYKDQCGTISAHCRSDARALIKEILGIPKKKRLPIEVQIERIEFNEST